MMQLFFYLFKAELKKKVWFELRVTDILNKSQKKKHIMHCNQKSTNFNRNLLVHQFQYLNRLTFAGSKSQII